jgi:hypothetical protein
MLGNCGKHLPHSVSHSLPLLLTLDSFIDKSRHIMGNHRSQAQLPHDLGHPSRLCTDVRQIIRQSSLCGKSLAVTRFSIWFFLGWKRWWHSQNRKRGAKAQVELAFFRKKKQCNSFLEVSLWHVDVKLH